MLHIGQLLGADAQLPCQNLPVASGLIQHVNVIGVFKDVFYLPGGQQVLYILGNAGGYAAPLPEPLPDFHGIAGGLLLLQKQVHLVDVVAG